MIRQLVLAVLFIFALQAPGAFAQVQFGVKAGILLNNFNNYEKGNWLKPDADQFYDDYIGPNVGIVVKKSFGEKWSGLAEAQLAYLTNIGDLQREYDLFLVSIPLLVQRQLNNFIKIQAGGTMNIILENEVDPTFVPFENYVDFMALAGIEFDLTEKFQIGVRGGLGLRPLGRTIFTDLNGDIARETIIREMQLSLHGTYFF
jgi:hypothetical protein